MSSTAISFEEEEGDGDTMTTGGTLKKLMQKIIRLGQVSQL